MWPRANRATKQPLDHVVLADDDLLDFEQRPFERGRGYLVLLCHSTSVARDHERRHKRGSG